MEEEKYLKLTVNKNGISIDNNFANFEQTLELVGLYMAAMAKQRKGVTEDTAPDQILASFMHRLHEFSQKFLKDV